VRFQPDLSLFQPAKLAGSGALATSWLTPDPTSGQSQKLNMVVVLAGECFGAEGVEVV